MSKECWMCTYSTDEIAQQVTTLIVENIHAMTIPTIAQQACCIITSETKSKYGIDMPQDVLQAEVQRHIKEHMLHANVTLAVTIQGLLELKQILRQRLQYVDEESGETVIDSSNIKNYLAVTNQIIGVYKTGDHNKLLFAHTNTAKDN